MASTRSQKSRALDEVEQELQEFEHLSKLMEHTGLANLAPQDLAEKAKKTTRRKAKKTEKIPAAIPSAVRTAETAEAEKEMELLRNQNYKLEMEILEKKLQLQKLMQTSPEVVRPIASTPLQGGFVDVVDNNQEFPQDIPTLDALRMRRNPTTKHPMLPHHFVMSNKGMLEYRSLSISEFVCGYLEMVKIYPQFQDDLHAHLQLLMEKATTYSWESVKNFHFSCNFLFDQCRMSWRQREFLNGKANTFFTHGDLRNTQRASVPAQRSKDREHYCKQWNYSGKCGCVTSDAAFKNNHKCMVCDSNEHAMLYCVKRSRPIPAAFSQNNSNKNNQKE